MNLFEARDLAVRLMQEFELVGWTFHFDLARRRFGQCRYGVKAISLSKYLTVMNGVAEVEDTIRHEIAHAIAGHEAGHGMRWKQVARACGANPTRCYDSATVSAPSKPFVGRCPSCSLETRAFRRTRVACKKCCNGKFDPPVPVPVEESDMKTNQGASLMKVGCALMFIGIVAIPLAFACVVMALTLMNWLFDCLIGK